MASEWPTKPTNGTTSREPGETNPIFIPPLPSKLGKPRGIGFTGNKSVRLRLVFLYSVVAWTAFLPGSDGREVVPTAGMGRLVCPAGDVIPTSLSNQALGRRARVGFGLEPIVNQGFHAAGWHQWRATAARGSSSLRKLG